MSETSLSDLDPEQLRKLLSITEEPEARNSVEEVASSSCSQSSDMPSQRLGSWIDRYKLTKLLGEGGMAIVYMAEQEYPVHREVALKLIKPGMDSKKVLRRFEMERQALTLLNHPNIAQIYDAGTTESGLPYFVMEYVKGLPITEYCDQQKITIEERLGLFLQICHAVHHAHQKGIIHRDIKPSNILVSVVDDQATPKIIDFGIAKAITQPLTDKTFFTADSQLLGTPEYMSPEQSDIANEDIDTRSDIYSLGVLLYVLLTGVLPFDSETIRKGGIEHVRQTIRKTDPKTPSTRLMRLGEEAKKVAERRRTEVAALAKCLHRELEWIPLKAMRKERAERYRSASELADDIENYLKGTPLIAGPPSTVYRLKKFIHRNLTIVTGIAAIVIVLIAGVVVSMLFALGQARARAEAQAVSEFLRNTVLASLDPYEVGNRAITNRSALDAISKGIEDKLTDYPLAQAEIRERLGFTYWSLGVYELSELHYRHAIEIYRAHLGSEHAATLKCMKNLGWVYYYSGRYDEAEKWFTDVLPGMQLVLGEEHEDTLHTMASLGCVYNVQGRFNEAEELLLRASETIKRKLGEENGHLVHYISMLGWGYTLQGRYDEAEQLFKTGLEISNRKPDEQYWIKLSLMQFLGELYLDLGQYKKAEQLLLKTLNGRQQSWGRQHPDTLWTMAILGSLYHSQDRYEEAEDLLREVEEATRLVMDDAHLLRSYALYELGTLCLSQEKHNEAETLLNNASDILCRILGEENWTTLMTTNALAKLYTVQGRYKEAEKTFRWTLETRVDKLGEEHPATLETKNDLAVLFKKQERYEEAEGLLHKVIEGRHLILGDTHPHTRESIKTLIDLYESWNKPEKAEEWRAKLQQTEAVTE